MSVYVERERLDQSVCSHKHSLSLSLSLHKHSFKKNIYIYIYIIRAKALSLGELKMRGLEQYLIPPKALKPVHPFI